jgi:hypothetical protein
MGAVLEMTMHRLALALLALTSSLAACGQDQEVNPITTATQAIDQLIGPPEPPLDIRASFTPEVLATINQPLLAAEMPARKANATMALAGENAGHRTWVAADGIMLITRDGILTGTRGFGRDLMVSDVSAVLPALRAGSGSVEREMSRINDETHVIPTRYRCTIASGGPQQVDLISRTFSTRLVTETCTDVAGVAEGFTNRYWLDSTGTIRQSDQWVGPRYGHALMYQLVD